MALIKQGNAEKEGMYELTSQIDPAVFEKSIDKVYRREVKRINIQGFRKGKAPRAVVERMYGSNFFYEDAINDALPEEFEAAVDEAGIEFIGRPDVEITEVGKDEGVTVVFTVQLRPELAVGKYKGIAGEKTVNTVESSEIDAEIEKLRDRASHTVSVDDRAAAKGDIANIDFEGFLDDKPFAGGKGEGYDLVLGEGQFIPGFEDQVAGHAIGEEFDVNVSFPEDYHAEDLAGKAVVFKVKLNKLSVKETPELDDELAKDVSEFETLAELKEDIKSRLQKEKDETSESELENSLVEAVAETLEGDIPDVMIEERMDEMVRDFGYRLQAQGMDLKTYLKYTGTDVAAFRDTFKEQAQKFIKMRLALEAVVRAENIEVTEDDFNKKVEELTKQYGAEADKIKESLPKKEIEADIKVSKAIEIIRENAKVKEKKQKADDKE